MIQLLKLLNSFSRLYIFQPLQNFPLSFLATFCPYYLHPKHSSILSQSPYSQCFSLFCIIKSYSLLKFYFKYHKLREVLDGMLDYVQSSSCKQSKLPIFFCLFVWVFYCFVLGFVYLGVFLFCFLFFYAYSMWKFLGQGSNLCHSSDNGGSLTLSATREHHSLYLYLQHISQFAIDNIGPVPDKIVVYVEKFIEISRNKSVYYHKKKKVSILHTHTHTHTHTQKKKTQGAEGNFWT